MGAMPNHHNTPTLTWRRMGELYWPVDPRTKKHPLRPNPAAGCDCALEAALYRILAREGRQTSAQLREVLANQEQPIHVGDAKLRETIAHLVMDHAWPIASDSRGFGYLRAASEFGAERAELSSRIRALQERLEATERNERIYLQRDTAALADRIGPDGETAASPRTKKVRRRRRKIDQRVAAAAKQRAPERDALEVEVSRQAEDALRRHGMTIDDIEVPF